jgi:hypothetical protein
MGCAGAALAAGWGLRFWAEVEIAAMSKTNRAILLKTFGIGEFFSLWSAPRLKKLGMEGKGGDLTAKDTKKHKGIAKISLRPLRVPCGYFFFFFAVDAASGCAPVTLAST